MFCLAVAVHSLLARILKVGVQSLSGPKARRGVWGHAPPGNFEKLKPLRRDFRDSDSCKRLSIYLLSRLFTAAGKVAWGRLGKSITLNSGFVCEIASTNFLITTERKLAKKVLI